MTSRDPLRCFEAVRSAILATALLLVLKILQLLQVCDFSDSFSRKLNNHGRKTFVFIFSLLFGLLTFYKF